jgi:MoaA/NifB/PqqE/SkfB family radical SAM enzyme
VAQGITDAEGYKSFRSPAYNYHFNKGNGLFVRWGETIEDDPQWSPYGPEIADIEISTGDCSSGCPWCYKSNGSEAGKHMTLSTLEYVLDSLPNTITQVALGITDADANPDFVAMLEACRERGIVPNYTTSGFGLTPEIEAATARLCGAVAVSVYPHNREVAWDTVRRLVGLGMEQVNVHLLYYDANKAFVQSVLREAADVDGLNAVVLLGLKPKGGAEGWKPMGQQAFSELVDGTDVRIGFDSCSAPKFEQWAAERGRHDLLKFSEPCESTLFSIYINVDGKALPCSFAEGCEEPIEIESAWTSPQFESFRNRLWDNQRRCPLYNLNGE